MPVSYLLSDGFIGCPPINTTADSTQRLELGQIVTAKDATYGFGEFEYVKFTGTVVAGDLVIVDRFNKTAIQSPAAAASAKGFHCGVAMAAQVSGNYNLDMATVKTLAASNLATVELYYPSVSGR
jgi:hypothetical protein